jgi:hypothetical protein
MTGTLHRVLVDPSSMAYAAAPAAPQTAGVAACYVTSLACCSAASIKCCCAW